MSIENVSPPTTSGAVPFGPPGWSPSDAPDPLMHRRGLLGAPISRLDGSLKVHGAARFAAEIPLRGMVYAALAFSSVAKGRIAMLDTSKAETAPGVVLVMTHRNAPRMHRAKPFLTSEKAAAGDDLPIMQDDRVYWNGQPIAVALAETQEQANHAVSLIQATFTVEPAITAFERARLHKRGPAAFGGTPLENRIGNAEAALLASPYKVDSTYSTPFQNHNAMELHAATLAWKGDVLRVHDCTQGVVHTAWSLAQIFGIREDQVHVSAPYVGGAFGGKSLWQHQVLAAAASKLARRPVRIMLSREGVYRAVGGRATTKQRVAIGARIDGRFAALIHTGTVATTSHNALRNHSF